MLDVAVTYNQYKFLGNEFLTWLWYCIEKDINLLENEESDPMILQIGNRIVLENERNDDSVETITIKGNDAGLEEGITALNKGAFVTELNIVCKIGENEWNFSLKGENLNFSSFKIPETANVESKEDIEGAILEKIYLRETIINNMDKIYKKFIITRISDKWKNETILSIKNWIKS